MPIIKEKVNSKEQPRIKFTGRWGIGLAVGAAIATSAVSVNQMQQGHKQATEPMPVISSTQVITAVNALGRLEPQDEVIELAPPSSAQAARVDQLLVKEGQRAKAGQVVAILDNRNRATAALEQAKGQVQVARANLAKVKAGAQAGEIDAQKATIARLDAQLRGEIVAQEATIDRLEAQLQGQKETQKATVARINAQRRNAQVDVERYEKLYKEGAISSQELDSKRLSAETSREQVNESQATRTQTIETLQQQLNEAKANRNKTITTLREQIDEAKATLNKIVEVRPTDVQVAQAEVDRAIAAAKQAQADLELAYVRAPITGEILKIHTRPGETISNKGIVEMGRTDQMFVIAEVLEEDISKVHLGQKARITSDNEAFARNLRGAVAEIGRQIGKQDVLDNDPAADVDARVVEVKIRLTPEDSQRVSGLTYAKVVVEINI